MNFQAFHIQINHQCTNPENFRGDNLKSSGQPDRDLTFELVTQVAKLMGISYIRFYRWYLQHQSSNDVPIIEFYQKMKKLYHRSCSLSQCMASLPAPTFILQHN
jgi:hypothetical protein